MDQNIYKDWLKRYVLRITIYYFKNRSLFLLNSIIFFSQTNHAFRNYKTIYIHIYS